MVTIIRGTTPTVNITGLDKDLSSWNVYVTFEWDSYVNHSHERGQITKHGTPVTVTSTQVSVALSQADTLAFPEKGTVKVQIKAYKSGDVVATNADDPASWFYAGTALLEEEIPLT